MKQYEMLSNLFSQQVGDIQKAQDNLHSEIVKISNAKEETEVQQAGGKIMPIVGPVIMYATLYSAAMSKSNGMDLPFHKFAEFVGGQSRYCEGFLDGLAALHPDKLKVEQGSRAFRKKVTIYDEAYFGTLDYWKDKAQGVNSEKLAKGLINAIDDYFSKTSNQLPPDSI